MKIIIKNKAKKKIRVLMQKNGISFSKSIYGDMIAKVKDVLQSYFSYAPSKLIICIDEQDGLNATNCISISYFCLISITWRWAYEMVFNDNAEIRNALVITFGHELGHSKAKTYIPFFIVTKLISNKATKWDKLRMQSIEVFCDFNGANMSGLSKKDIIAAKEYEHNLNVEIKKGKNVNDFIHPEHSRRMTYLKNEQFDKRILSTIASDVGYSKNKSIDKYWNYFEKVIDNGKYIKWYIFPLSLINIFVSLIFWLVIICGVITILLKCVLVLFS